MSEPISIVERQAQPVVEVPATTRLWKIPVVLANGFRDAGNYIEQRGARRVNMPFARYLEIDWQSLRGKGAFGQFIDFLTTKQKMRIGLQIEEAPERDQKGEAEAGVEVGEIAAGRYVTTYHRGAYHKVGDTYRKIVDWAHANKVALSNNSIEHYIDDPSEKPTEDVRTEIFIAVVGE